MDCSMDQVAYERDSWTVLEQHHGWEGGVVSCWDCTTAVVAILRRRRRRRRRRDQRIEWRRLLGFLELREAW
jgi:hypothetical protein